MQTFNSAWICANNDGSGCRCWRPPSPYASPCSPPPIPGMATPPAVSPFPPPSNSGTGFRADLRKNEGCSHNHASSCSPPPIPGLKSPLTFPLLPLLPIQAPGFVWTCARTRGAATNVPLPCSCTNTLLTAPPPSVSGTGFRVDKRKNEGCYHKGVTAAEILSGQVRGAGRGLGH